MRYQGNPGTGDDKERPMSVQTIPELFLTAVRENPRPDCFSYRDDSGQYVDVSSEEALRRVKALRMGLKSLGVKPGDKVALLSENRIEWALADLGSLCAGAVTVPVYPTLLTDTIEYILSESEPVAIFVSTEEQAAKIHQIRDRLPSLRDVISFDRTGLPDIMTLDKLKQIGQNLLEANPPAPRDECVTVDKDSPCSIIYTSGTTGNPKGVVLSHWNFVSNVLTIREMVPISSADRCLSFLPLSHVLERMGGLFTMLSVGASIAFAEKMESVPQDIMDVHPTFMISVPRLYEKIYAKAITTASGAGFPKKNIFFWARDIAILQAKMKVDGPEPGAMFKIKYAVADKLVFSKLRAKLGGKIQLMISGGAPLNMKINQFFNGAGLSILEGYGLTETSPILTANTFDNFRYGSVGKAIPGTDLKIAEDGEIIARGPQVMLEYYKNEAATREVLDDEGWLATGDIGHLDADGYLFITDRKKDLIVTAGGKNIAPQPIENRYVANKYVIQTVVIGDRRQFLSALIVPNFETLQNFATSKGISAMSPADLVRHPEVNSLFESTLKEMNEDLPGFSQIRKFTLLEREFTLDDGELTPTMKIKRFAINTKYKKIIDTMYPAPLDGEDH
jgi:long-chain acyl-CoA synthetase